MGIGEGTDNWPKDPATGKDLIRFDWRVGKHDDSINTAGLQRVVDRIRLVGPQMGDENICGWRENTEKRTRKGSE